MYIPPKKETTNNIPADAAHFLRTEIDSTDFKNENLTTKIRRNKSTNPYLKKQNIAKDLETDETLQLLDEISTLKPRKNAQLAAKKYIYKKLREENTRKKKYKIPGEIVRIEKVETDQGEVKVPVSIEKPKGSGKEAAKKIIKKYDKISREKPFKKIVDAYEKRKKNKNIEIVEDIKNFAAKKSARITANKIFQKYKSMKRPRKTYLVNEEDLETTDYNEPQENLFQGESIVEATNKVLDFKAFKKDQANALKEMKKKEFKE